ncbi:MAG: 1-deoxy-D-xylulose-5-phosphate reductoisomerase [candidate division Zixibacteria bacterium]|nr:1-deoxy-D-xylulose-5-phosphate reductoisomerase [candidate division Zixibacteria bacterium]
MRKVVVLGATGSIGCQTLEVAARFPDKIRVVGLSAGSNISLVAEQTRQFGVRNVVLKDEKTAEEFRRFGFLDVEVLLGIDGLCRLASLSEADTVVNGLVGSLGLRPSLAALEAGKRLCLANKEALVMGGQLVLAAKKRGKGELVPIDSEHSALFQCLLAGGSRGVRRVFLTASGGPFLNWPKDEMLSAKPSDALKHPTWTMGKKITIDSATLFNKALEVIEAHFLFGLTPEQIEVVVHPQSIVHSLVEFADGSTMAQLGPPDMRIPIQYALSYPERWESPYGTFGPMSFGNLNFLPLDNEKFPSVKMAYRALQMGGTAPAVLAAADECAVGLYLEEKISFGEIFELVGEALEAHQPIESPTVEDIEGTERWARAFITDRVKVSV